MSKNFKTGLFKRRELLLYGLEENQIDIIIKYQKLLPILQEDNDKLINTRLLHEQLKLKTKYADWIPNMIQHLDLNEGKDYKVLYMKDNEIVQENDELFKQNVEDMNKNQLSRSGISTDYFTNIEIAKEISMIAGIGNRVNQETKEISKIARKYFIYIEQAFKDRYNWNVERDKTLIKCKELKDTIQENEKILLDTVPCWSANVYQAEFCLLNEVVTGMNAKTFREENNLKPSDPIRNHFTKDTLNIIAELEKFDADLIAMMDIYDYEARRKLLRKKFLKIA